LVRLLQPLLLLLLLLLQLLLLLLPPPNCKVPGRKPLEWRLF